MKYYADQQGQYLGAFDGVEPPVGSVEVPKAPKTARDIWDGQKWIDAEPLPVLVVDMAQARLALINAGHLDKVEPIIEAMPEPQKSAARIEWEYRARVRRDSDLTQAIAAAIPLSDEEMDQLFTTAATL